MTHSEPDAAAVYGLSAEFDSAQALLDAAAATTRAGYTRTDAYSPFPIHGLAEALDFHDRRISWIVLIGGIVGLCAGFGLEVYCQVISFPLNIGGRPMFSWVAFIPPAFETTILFGSFTAGISMAILNGLPRPYHPMFNVPRFSLASQDKFFLAIEAADPKFDLDDTRAFLTGLHAREVVTVEE
jgi:hypothetical protein